MACRSTIDSIEFVHVERARVLPPDAARREELSILNPEDSSAEFTQPDGGQVESGLGLLDKLAPPEPPGQTVQSEVARPLRLLPPGPSRSLGGYLDYSGWPERERFLELDRAIQLQAWLESDRGDDAGPPEKYSRALAACNRLARAANRLDKTNACAREKAIVKQNSVPDVDSGGSVL